MPNRESHLLQAERFESFLKQIERPDQIYKEWVVIVWFHIALHYVDAFLAVKNHDQIADHSQRWALMENFPETRSIFGHFQRLYKESKEARYQGTPFTGPDLDGVKPLYIQVRDAMRKSLGLTVRT
jgi:hypothetical protein